MQTIRNLRYPYLDFWVILEQNEATKSSKIHFKLLENKNDGTKSVVYQKTIVAQEISLKKDGKNLVKNIVVKFVSPSGGIILLKGKESEGFFRDLYSFLTDSSKVKVINDSRKVALR